ncbi:carboxylesterase [Pseudomaricurvus alkylphenolicus]|uniref:alpha/beta hydrolase n=1 Tax=Pseudomaricurvus alkylphenolicus TaxID=1306991 RepID=UPI0014202665|nr:dienelactone hydrolase family protein [Pseudomaricurvus alkylphenolicus]NIB41451.1 carboxylesterase [Pseudomaricurvus alkylphenolicus]
MNYLPCVEIEPRTPANAAVIWLHGLGASGDDFAPIVPELNLPEDLAVRFVFPHAPSIPVTINGGMVMPAWYDILSLDIDRKIDSQQILQSAAAVTDLIDREIERGIDSQRIIVAGFSQGGAVAYQAALSYPAQLAGLMALSTYFATSDSIELNAANQSLPMFVSHGTQDPVVPEMLGQRAVENLQEKGFEPDYKVYPMQHEVCLPQIRDIARWLQERLP